MSQPSCYCVWLEYVDGENRISTYSKQCPIQAHRRLAGGVCCNFCKMEESIIQRFFLGCISKTWDPIEQTVLTVAANSSMLK